MIQWTIGKMLKIRGQEILQVVFIIVLLIGASKMLAQQTPANKAVNASSGQNPKARPMPAYKTLRYEEDWSFLRDKSKRTDFFDPIKYIPLRRDSEDWYLTIGGELHPYPERIGNDGFGSVPPDDNGYFLNRAMLHFDFHFGKRVRAFVDFKSGLQTGRRGGSRPIDDDCFDLHQAFIDFRYEFGGQNSGSQNKTSRTSQKGGQNSASGEQNSSSRRPWALTFRLGRQELSYGIGRLIALREGPNVRQSFDAARLIAEVKSWRVDGFYAKPVKTKRGVFDTLRKSLFRPHVH